MIIPSNTTHGKLIIKLFHYLKCNVFLYSGEYHRIGKVVRNRIAEGRE